VPGPDRPSLGRRIGDFFFGYDFFVSYAHRDGAHYPRALGAALQKLGYRVFLDEREYAPGDDLRIGTRRMVTKSRYLVLVARDGLVQREENDEASWVRREIEACLQSGRTPVVIDVNGAFSRASPSNRLHRLLADRIFVPETLEDPDGRPSAGVLDKLSAGFKATRQETLRLRWISSAAFALLVLTAVAIWQGWLAERRRVEAERQRDDAWSRLLTIEARRLGKAAPDTALLLAAAGARIQASAAGMALLRELLLAEPRLERFLQAQTAPWRRAVFAPDGSALLVAADDGSITRLFVEATGLRAQPLERPTHPSQISTLALSPDGARAAAGTADGKRVFLWDLRSGRLERTLEADHGNELPVEGLAFAPDSRLLVSGGTFTRTFLWSVASGERIAQLDQHTSGVRAIAFAPDGSRVATAAEGGRIVIWRLWEMPPAHDVIDEAVPAFVFSLAFSPDGNQLAAGGEDGSVAIWPLEGEDREPVRLRARQPEPVARVQFIRAGAAVAVLTRDGRVSFYDRPGGSDLRMAPIEAGPTAVADFAFLDDGKTLLTIGPGSYVRRWVVDMPLEAGARVLPGHDKGTVDVAFAADGSLLSIGCPGPRAPFMDPGCAFGIELRRWDPIAASALGDPIDLGGRQAVRIVPRADRSLLLVLAQGHLAIWDPQHNRISADHPRPAAPKAPVGADPKPVLRVPDAPHGGTSAPHARVIPVSGQLPAGPCAVYNTSPDAIAVAPDGKAVYYAGGTKGCVFRWREDDGWTVAPVLERGTPISAIAIPAGERQLALGGKDGSVEVWTLAPDAKAAWRSTPLAGSPVTALAFSRSGETLAVGYRTFEAEPRKGFIQRGRTVGSALLLRVAENRVLANISTEPPSLAAGPVGAVDFSPDGALAVIGGCRTEGGIFGCSRGELVLWDVIGSQQLGPPIPVHQGAVRRVALSADGALLATVADAHTLGNDPRIAVWDLDAAAWIARACRVVGRGLTAQEKDRHLGGIYYDPCAPRQGS
jgi:WD40 repeat protein